LLANDIAGTLQVGDLCRPELNVSEIIWMISDSLECPRTEFGPYYAREAAEVAAIRLGMRYLLRYEYENGYKPETSTGRVSAVQIPANVRLEFLTRCATCGSMVRHQHHWEAEASADIHEFENSKHVVRLFVKTENTLVEVPDWRKMDRIGGCAE
jgi:hypothetical protein